jgi:hypothetical protein
MIEKNPFILTNKRKIKKNRLYTAMLIPDIVSVISEQLLTLPTIAFVALIIKVFSIAPHDDVSIVSGGVYAKYCR